MHPSLSLLRWVSDGARPSVLPSVACPISTSPCRSHRSTTKGPSSSIPFAHRLGAWANAERIQDGLAREGYYITLDCPPRE